MTSTTDQQRPQAWAEEIRTCLLSGPGRGDCEHFVGWPDIEDESTTDVWGVPFGWCIVCYWRHHALAAQATVARQGKEIEHPVIQWALAQTAQRRRLVALIPPDEAHDGPRYAGYYCEDGPELAALEAGQ